MSIFEEILEEWDGGCFYNELYLLEAYRTFLKNIAEGVQFDSDVQHSCDFLDTSFGVFRKSVAPHSVHQEKELHRDVLNMIGGKPVTRARAKALQLMDKVAARSPLPDNYEDTSNLIDGAASDVTTPTNFSASTPAASTTAVPTPAAPAPAASTTATTIQPVPSPPSPATPSHALLTPDAALGISSSQSDPRGLKRKGNFSDESNQDGSENEPTIEILETRERALTRFKIKMREESVLIKGLGDELLGEDLMVSLFDTVLERQRKAVSAKEDDRCIVEIQNSENVENPIWFHLRKTSQLNGKVILDRISSVLNSNQNFMIDGQLKFLYIHVPTIRAGGMAYDRRPNESMDKWIIRKIKSKTIFYPENSTDQMCLTRSVVVAKARGSISKQALCRLKKKTSVVQRKEALKLCEMAKIDPQQSCTLDDVAKLQNILPDYRLVVYTDQKGKEIVFNGPKSNVSHPRKTLHLLLNKGHFSAILYPKQAFEFSYQCEVCLKLYTNRGVHFCAGSCWRCSGSVLHDAPNFEQLTRCKECCRYFAGEECFNYHRTVKLYEGNRTTCQARKFCVNCDTSYSLVRGGKHICGFYTCHYCKEYVKEGHLCYVTQWTEKELNDKVTYHTVYFDIETTQNTHVKGKPESWNEHIPNLLISQCVCLKCDSVSDKDYFCSECGQREHIFHSIDDKDANVVGQFLDYLQELSSERKVHITILAHNMKGFDGVFILQELHRRKMKPEVILQGSKILYIRNGNWELKDSLCFLPMKLSAMPKSFSLTELKKGYFPFLANHSEFYEYEGPMLNKEYYCESIMKKKDSDNFNKWYDEQVKNNYVFNFRREIIEYCESDVCILREACEAFRKLFQEIAGFDPLRNGITLSSVCMAAFRRNFLKPKTIGIVPHMAYRGRDMQSHIALKWLDYQQFLLGDRARIQTSESADGEKKVLNRKVDGYYELKKEDGSIEKVILNFHGDYHHACPIHFPAPDRVITNTKDRFAENAYERTQRVTNLFRRNGYTVIEKWECQFNDELKTNEDMKKYFEDHPTKRSTPLRLKDALAGGRTSALRAYAKADLEKGQRILFYDVTSEYPSANLKQMYPAGHPKIYLEGDPEIPSIQQWNGVIKATVLPPQDLFLPVLPYKACGKLLFPLCRSCAETCSQEECSHEDPSERCLTGTWCAPELQLAVLQKNYKILTVHEVYQYPETMQFNPDTMEDGLLSGYVRCFMALKMEASGWPEGCDTPEERKNFLEATKKTDGIILNPDKIVRNEALRTLAKLKLNSLWGKYAENSLRPKTVFIYDYAELMALICDPTIEVQNLLPLTDDCLQVSWKPIAQSEDSLPTTSFVTAAFTTCYGRLQLYGYLDIVQERALYHDTDSVAFLQSPYDSKIETGPFLGQMVDSIAEEYGHNSFILEFVAAGAKNYAYKVAVGGDPNNVKYCIKVRGITINNSCCDLLTFENIKRLVLEGIDPIHVPIPRQIARTKDWKIVTRSTSKKWQECINKRRRIGLEYTVPHGYKPWEGFDESDLECLATLGELAAQREAEEED